MTEGLWQLDRVALHGSGGQARLRDVTVAIEPGITAVLGQSGAGKTSLLNLLVGYEVANAGSITSGDLLTSKSDRAPMFWSPGDSTGGLWPGMTVREQLIAVTPGAMGATTQAVDAMLSAFELTAIADAKPHRLSQGERSRVSVARTLMSGARVLVMDEPLAHVDASRLGSFWKVIREHLRATGASLVFSTHHAETVLAEASRVICLEAGRVIFAGTVEDLYRRPPTVEAARCLGEVNVLTREEAGLWVDPKPNDLIIRPEHLDISLDPGGAAVVQSFRFRGTTCDVQLHHEQHATSRGFTARAPAAPLKPGDRVSLRFLLLLMLAMLLSACGSGSDPVLHVERFSYQQMPANNATLPTPRGIAIGRDGELIVLDKAGRVLIYNRDRQLLRHWWMPEYQKGMPEGACLLKDGRIAVADTHYARIVLFDQEGNVTGMFGSEGRGPGQFIYPVKVVQDDAGFIYVLEYGGNDRVQKFDARGAFVLSFGSFTTEPGGFSRPGGIVWHEGKIYVSDADNHRIQAFHDDGTFIAVLTNEGEPLVLDFPYDLAIGPDGLLYVIEYGAGRLTVLTTQGKLMGRYGSAGRGQGQFSTPWGIRVDDRKHVWIADTGNRRLVELEL